MTQRGEYVKHHGPTWEGSFELIRESPLAMLLWDGEGTTDNAKWVPRSQILNVTKTRTPKIIEVEMTEWIAKEKGFV